MKLKILNIPLNIIILFILLIVAAAFICYTHKYNILMVEDDTWVPFLSNFLNPYEGRFIACGLINLLVNKLSLVLNIHPNDLQNTYVAYFKSVIAVTIIFLITYSGFIFKKNKFSYDFHLAFITIFLIIYNCSGFLYSSHIKIPYYYEMFYYNYFLNTLETAGFFEYIFNLLYYIPLVCIIYKSFDTELSKKEYIIGCITAFLCGITVEIINVPTIIFILVSCIFAKLKQCKNFKFLSLLFLLNLSSVILYYVQYLFRLLHPFSPSESLIFLNEELINYIYIFLKPHIPFFIVILTVLLISFYKLKNLPQRNITWLISFNYLIIIFSYSILCFVCKYFFKFTLINEEYLLTINIIILVNFIISVGYLIDKNEKITAIQSTKLKFILCCLILIINHKPLLIDYYPNIQHLINIQKNERIERYKMEKWILSKKDTKENDIILPVQSNNISKNEEVNKIYIFYFDKYIINSILYIYCNEFKNSNIIMTPSYNYDNKNIILSDEELQNLHFSDLINNKITNCFKIENNINILEEAE